MHAASSQDERDESRRRCCSRSSGSLEPGKFADLVVIDAERLSLAPSQTIVSNLVYSNDPWAVRDVFVGGEQVVSDGEHRSLDRRGVVAGARTAFGRVLQVAGLESYVEGRSRWKWQYRRISRVRSPPRARDPRAY